ncbi:MAG: 30S ribosomal protein S20 [Desulfobulbaceae bacterium]|nr:30S ribosomal protein S20 [Desulfobulbaceae bacterium]
MANHKSALKRNRQNVVRRARNRANKTKIKNAVKAVDAALEENSLDAAKAALQTAIPVIMRAASKGTIPKKTASRKVSRLTKRVNGYVASQAA